MTLFFMDDSLRPMACDNLCFTWEGDKPGLNTFKYLLRISPWKISPSYTSLKESIPREENWRIKEICIETA